jgi:hypothetical protein
VTSAPAIKSRTTQPERKKAKRWTLSGTPGVELFSSAINENFLIDRFCTVKAHLKYHSVERISCVVKPAALVMAERNKRSLAALRDDKLAAVRPCWTGLAARGNRPRQPKPLEFR